MKCTAPTVPAWAEKIEVERRGSSTLIVRGTGRSSYTVILTTNEVPIQALSRDRKRPIHLQFADSCTYDELVNFVRTHGPIWGVVQRKARGKDQKEYLIVRQDLPRLLSEQKLFRAAVHLLIELQDRSQNLEKIRSLISQISQVYPRETASDKRVKIRTTMVSMALLLADNLPGQGPRRTNDAVRQQRIRSEAVRYNAVSAGHGALCELFNRFPPKLFPCSDGSIELPSYDREGILPILYFLLRKDYRDRHHLIKLCKECDTTFKAERGDSDFCKRTCYKKYNDRDRYLRKKRTTRQAAVNKDIVYNVISTFSTAQAAKKIGVHKMTLLKWLWAGKVAEPRRQVNCGQDVRIWTEQDLLRVQEYKEANFRRGRGRKKKPSDNSAVSSGRFAGLEPT
jgi:hypothetical protein